MDILFIHGNYPGQFRHIAPMLGQNEQQRVIFLTEREDAECEPIPGVQIRNFKCHRKPSSETHHYLSSSEDAILRGQAVAREIGNLLEDGFNPRIVITHGGMGLGLFIKDLLPHTIHIGYFEWFFLPETTRYLVREYNINTQLMTGLRNMPILQELERCNLCVTPTEWQKRQFPKAYQNKIRVIFDGVDQSYFHPYKKNIPINSQNIKIKNRETKDVYIIEKDEKIISYATRGMEPLRGFPEFVNALPELLKSDNNLKIIIAGKDRRAYSYDAPTNNGSWKDHMLAEIGEIYGKERIVFTGLLDYEDYRMLLWRSDLHCYFTRPYVTSWSLFEAASCEAKLAINKNSATEGIVVDGTVTWIDIDSKESMSRQMKKGLESRKRSRIEQGYELKVCIRKWEILLNIALKEYT